MVISDEEEREGKLTDFEKQLLGWMKEMGEDRKNLQAEIRKLHKRIKELEPAGAVLQPPIPTDSRELIKKIADQINSKNIKRKLSPDEKKERIRLIQESGHDCKSGEYPYRCKF